MENNMKKIFKKHAAWLQRFGMGMILFITISLVLFLLGAQDTSSKTAYVPFHDLKKVPITNVKYLDNDSRAYVEGIADGNRKIHIDVYDGKIPSNFKNTNTAIVFETSDKDLYLNQESYDESNPKISNKDIYTSQNLFFGYMIIISIGLSAYFATFATKARNL